MSGTVIADVLLWGGGLLVAVIGWFTANWMLRTDRFKDETGKILARHDTDIALAKQGTDHVVNKVDELAALLRTHTEDENKFWRDNEASHARINEQLALMDQRVARNQKTNVAASRKR